MSNDLSGTIKTSFQSTTTEAGALSSKVTQLTAATKAHNAEAAKTTEHTKRIREEMAKAKEEAHELGERFHALAGAGRILGGPLGELVQHFGHIGKAGAENVAGFGRIAAAAGMLGLAIEILNKISERRSEILKENIEAENKYRETVEASRKADGSAANGAGGASDARNRLLAVGGRGAVEDAEGLANEIGVLTKDVEKGMAESYKLPDDQREQGIAAVTILAKSGLTGFAEGMNLLVGNFNARMATSAHEAADILAHEVKTGKSYGANGTDLDIALANTGSDPVMNRIRQDNRDKNAGDLKLEKDYGKGVGSGLTKEERANAIAGTGMSKIGEQNFAHDVDLETKRQLARRGLFEGEGAWDGLGRILFNATNGTLGWGPEKTYQDALNAPGSNGAAPTETRRSHRIMKPGGSIRYAPPTAGSGE